MTTMSKSIERRLAVQRGSTLQGSLTAAREAIDNAVDLIASGNKPDMDCSRMLCQLADTLVKVAKAEAELTQDPSGLARELSSGALVESLEEALQALKSRNDRSSSSHSDREPTQ